MDLCNPMKNLVETLFPLAVPGWKSQSLLHLTSAVPDRLHMKLQGRATAVPSLLPKKLKSLHVAVPVRKR